MEKTNYSISTSTGGIIPIDSMMRESGVNFESKLRHWKENILDVNMTKQIAAESSGFLLAILEGHRNSDPVSVAIALSKLVHQYPVALRFSEEFFNRHGNPMAYLNRKLQQLSLEEPLRKKQRRSLNSNYVLDDSKTLLRAVLILMKKWSAQVYSNWDLRDFLKLLKTEDSQTRWLTVNCIGLLLNLTEIEMKKSKQHCKIATLDDIVFGLELQNELNVLCEQNIAANILQLTGLPKDKIIIVDEDSSIISVGGIIMKSNVNSYSEKSQFNSIVPLTSLVKYVKEIVLQVSSQFSPVCVVGPIGCGKSSLLQYTASLFGRISYPDFIVVQMSDQIDSRLLLGSYHSTDLPGQFVWKPGCLTKSVLNGHWIVLEDLDSAPSDVIGLLDALTDTGHLSVPGYGEIGKVHPNFRIFATSRTHLVGGRKAGERIGKQWKKIIVDPLPKDELKLLVQELFPNLKSILDRLIDIYGAMEIEKSLTVGGSGGNRVVSLRDFLKLCRRIPSVMDFTNSASAIGIFQEAYDLFVSSLRCPDAKQVVAEVIGTHLNLLKAKTEYFCSMYKPHVSICSNTSTLTSGRYSLPMYTSATILTRDEIGVFSLTKRACCLMEMISGSVKHHEPVLLIGETGVGKTSCVQYLAKILRQKLVVINLNRQSDSGDLLGGYKPVELKYIFAPLREEFETLFVQTFNREANSKFLGHIMTCFANKRWKDLVKLMAHVQKSAIPRCNNSTNSCFIERWTTFGHQLSRIETQILNGEESPFAFSFIEGTLINAVKKGYWILLDEINLATPEMLQCLSGILDENAQIHLWEKGDEKPIQRHLNFHLFAAMNPSTDVGKKDLPVGLRNRFTEFYVEELTDPDELRVLVSDYLREMSLSASQVDNIVQFYLKIKCLSQTALVDGMGKKPHFSLRTLCRALKISSLNLYGSVSRSLYESFCLSFLTQLDYVSHPVVQNIVAKYIFGKTEVKSLINKPLPAPLTGRYIQIEGYWILQGDDEPEQPEKYILTSSVRRNLKDLTRIVSAGKLPVLIQGETSVGKTSLIQYLAKCSGNKCYRINNHQHTDLQEYVGSYQSDDSGKLVFTEGVLVQAMRSGEWIILDELNLAPSEVLEALNRLLDDNRQLFITESGQTVTAHPRFMLFATQNPPGLYGGRKLLSRAFRNRFVELHFDEIPSNELETILNLRCDIPQSYCKKIIGVMKELQVRRKSSAALQGKHGFATLRDLFRWAERYRLSDQQKTKFYDWDQHLADEGYLVLAGKVRKSSEVDVIREVLQKHLKRKVDPQNLFSLNENTSSVTEKILKKVLQANIPEFEHIVWTYQMRKLVVLIGNAFKFNEPVLLVGETGCGKTTVVQLLCRIFGQKLFTVNCHMHSEGSDFLGGLRPVRCHQQNDERLFEWVNGPLVEAMESGGNFLADEISLADDSVLERINSVLEPERTLLIAEKGDVTPRLVIAHKTFHFVGTMNPGGDYGKKELSPALRNRLTEIWCEVSSDDTDMIAIIEHNLKEHLRNKGIGDIMTGFVKWLKNNELVHRCTVSIRDLLSWVTFVNEMTRNGKTDAKLSIVTALHHGASLAFLDGVGSGRTATENVMLSKDVKAQAVSHLTMLIGNMGSMEDDDQLNAFSVILTENMFGIGPFTVPRNAFVKQLQIGKEKFAIEAPTTMQNAIRLLRAMQLKKPILLEGSPGVGKTALVSAVARMAGFPLVRINLSEQTDISDLFGADLPVEGGTSGHFAWRDGPLLQALKNNSWILLDELNLASQSVLEGLNACLDHRGEIYVPELNKVFKISGENMTENFTRIVGCQNPLRQGGARKGLPRSFLNRFTQVFMDPLEIQDMKYVLKSSWPELPSKIVDLMTTFATVLSESVCQKGLFGAKGSPWDFNLRDLMRWAELVVNETCESRNVERSANFHPELFVDIVYGLRMRCQEDRRKVLQLFCVVWKDTFQTSSFQIGSVMPWGQSELVLTETTVRCGKTILERVKNQGSTQNLSKNQLIVLHRQLAAVEALGKCLEMNWMPILVGSTGSGKTSVVKLVAQLCGRGLKIMNPSSEMDTIELLGGFEQADIYRKIDETCVEMSDMLLQLVKKSILGHRRIPKRNGNENSHVTAASDLKDIKDDSFEQMSLEILELWSAVKALPHLAPEGLSHEEEMRRIRTRVDFLQTSYLRCKSFLESESRNLVLLSSYEKDAGEGSETAVKVDEHVHLERVSRELEQIYTHLKAGIQTGAFQWIDSLLIKAIVNGDWLLIDGANRCTAAVLDRLNSLMEPNGSLLLSERGSIDGVIVEIRPHQDFRLILTMDPAFGEISRAMRNRGVEIYMGAANGVGGVETSIEESLNVAVFGECNDSEELQSLGRVLGWTDADVDSALVPEFGINSFDLDALLRAEGLGDPRLREAVVNLHLEIRKAVASQIGSGDRTSVYEVILSARSMVLQMQHGISVVEAFQNAFLSTCIRSNNVIDPELKSRIVALLMSFSSQLEAALTSNSESTSPSRLTLSFPNFMNSQLYRVWNHLEIVRTLKSCEYLTPIKSIMQKISNVALLEDFVVLSVFSRVLIQDIRSLALAIESNNSSCASFATKLMHIMESNISLGPKIPEEIWDIQWVPHQLSKLSDSEVSNDGTQLDYLASVARVSLLLQGASDVFTVKPEDSYRSGTLGYVSKNIKYSEGGKTSEFLNSFWYLIVNFNSIVPSGLKQEFDGLALINCDKSEEFAVRKFAKVWRKGISTFLWRRRINKLLEVDFNLKRPSEKLISNATLLVQWIGENVVPFLENIWNCSRTIQDQNVDMRTLVKNCLETIDYCCDRVLLDKNEILRVISETKPFSALTQENIDAVEKFMDVCLGVWSLNSTLTRRRLISFLSSQDGYLCHANLTMTSHKVLSGKPITSDEVDFLTLTKANVTQMREFTPTLQDSRSVTTDLRESVLALVHFLRLSGRNVSGDGQSAFINPILAVHRLNQNCQSNALEKYLQWEEIEIFKQIFVDIPVGVLQNSCLLPYFTSNILLESKTYSFRNITLGCKDVSSTSLSRVNSLLSSELMKSYEEPQTRKRLLFNMCTHFEKELNNWSSVLGDNKSNNYCPEDLIRKLKNISSSEDIAHANDMAALGALMVQAASSVMEVSSMLPIVDPAVEKEILSGYLTEEIAFFETWLTVQKVHQLILTGVNIGCKEIHSVHPYIFETVRHLQNIRHRLAEAQTAIAVRPEPPSYDAIRQDIRQFVTTLASRQKIQELVTNVIELVSSTDAFATEDKINSSLIPCLNWIDAQKNFSRKLMKHFWYWDITAGFLHASSQAAVGFSILCDAIRRKKLGPSSSFKSNVLQLVTFPMPYGGKLINLTGVHEEPWALHRSAKKVFMASVVSFMNELTTQELLTAEIVMKLQNLSQDMAQLWTEQEDEKLCQKQFEDAQYIFKGKERKIGLSDEEQEIHDISNTFPDFEYAYKDLEQEDCLMDSNVIMSNDRAKEIDGVEYSGELKPEDVALFLKVHSKAIGLVKTHWIGTQCSRNKDDAVELDLVTPFMTQFELGCLGYQKNAAYFDRDEEHCFILGATVASNHLMTGQGIPEFFKATTLDDFYHDSNVSEAQKLNPIFIGLRKRVKELLAEWPDHPSLQRIVEIIERIESFKMNSPLMKFLTGLEMLLGVAQEWESCAHHGVSIAIHLSDITDLIMTWRKLELQCWKNLLEISFDREQNESHIWWFHLFSAIMEAYSSPEVISDNPAAFLTTLHRFMESSPIGQFHTRLNLLFNMHRHVLALEQYLPLKRKLTKSSEFLHPFIWNTYTYYAQFSESVTTRLTSLRAPIEKKMKDFVKISRWNDANYYALKDSVQKSQKMLNKLVSEFKKVLRIPVATVLVASIGNENQLLEKKMSKLNKLRLALYLMPQNWKEKCKIDNSVIKRMKLKTKYQSRFFKLPKLFEKIRGITQRVVEKNYEEYAEEILNLDELTIKIVQTTHELQALEVTEQSREKRKKALHNVHNLRRTNLAELFKALQQLNLSYRRGLIHIKTLENNTRVFHDFRMEPMELETGWQHLSDKSEKYPADIELIAAWNGCENYFQKCASRISVMMKAFDSPSKELGPNIIDRCKGFVADLMNVISGQKIILGTFSRFLWSLRMLTDFQNSESRHEEAKIWTKKFYLEACSIEFSTKQYQIVVNSVTQSFTEEISSINSLLMLVLQKSSDVKILLKPVLDGIPILEFKDAVASSETLKDCAGIFSQITDLYMNLEDTLGNNSILGAEFGKLKINMFEFVEHFEQNSRSISLEKDTDPQATMNDKRGKRFMFQAQAVLHNLLLTFQNLDKIEDNMEVLGSNYTSNSSQRMTVVQTICFNVEEVVTGVLKMKKMLIKYPEVSDFQIVLQGMTPLLKQYCMAGQFYLTVFVQYHRVACKLLSVLSAIFTNLGQKGFCLPNDYENEAIEEGPELDAKSGMGLGEGETTSDAQDVSDRIESEDQLEDTLKQGESLEPANKDLNDDEKGVEMSDDFEGKQQEKDQKKNPDGEDDEQSDSDNEKDELDKQMGDVDDPSADKLDDQMWGGSSDEEDEDIEDKEEEKGKGAPRGSEPEIGAKDPTLEDGKNSDSEEEPEDDPKCKDKQKKGQDINEIDDENDIDEDQVDPFHGQNKPEVEPEALDLPDDLNLDGAEPKDGEVPEENPFDLDAKEKELTDLSEDIPKETDNPEEQQDSEQMSDDEDPENGKGVNVEMPDLEENEKLSDDKEDKLEEMMEIDEDETQEQTDTAEDPSQSIADNESEMQKSEDKAEPSEDSEGKSNDQHSVANENAKAKNVEQIEMNMKDEENSSKNDEQAAGQAESEDGTGHEGKAVQNEKSQSSKEDVTEKDASRKPGETDSNRSLADDTQMEQKKKRLKTLDKPEANKEECGADEEENLDSQDDTNKPNAEIYQHITSAEKQDSVTIDNANQEQAENQKDSGNSDENPKLDDSSEDEMKADEQTEEIEEVDLDKEKPDLIRGLPQKKKIPKESNDAIEERESEEFMDVDGDKVLTYGAQRPAESSVYTIVDLLDEWDKEKQIVTNAVESTASEFAQNYMTSTEEAASLSQWHDLEGKTLPLAQELCEQLRLILEPTQAARLKGDYKTGKRLNMRKVIPYIASGFRKDKIWLRRTQPSKREYQILLALDDSASMSDNQSKQMAFSAVAVVARSLGLLEAGQLAVLSFGEDVQLMHPFEEPFTDFSGARLMQNFSFCQKRTRIAQLMECSINLFSHAKLNQSTGASNIPLECAQLLLIISDGRGVCHEGSDTVKKAVKMAREQNIFIVFIIVDNPDNKDSILDIRQPVFGPGNTVDISKYMDHFPFPFYLILRDLSSLPSVLSDALRQWFELVTSSER